MEASATLETERMFIYFSDIRALLLVSSLP